MLALFRKLLAKMKLVDNSVDKIVAPLTKIVTALETHAEEQKAKAEADAKKAEELAAAARAKVAEASRANDLAKNVGTVLGATSAA